MAKAQLFAAFLCYAVLLLSHVNGFLPDGALEQVTFAQNAVTRNEHHSTLLAVKLKTSTIILDIRKRTEAQPTLLKSAGQLAYRNNQLLALFVGRRADCQQARLMCSELDVKCQQTYGVPLSASKLSLQLADIAQQRSMEVFGNRQLAYNALILNTDRTSRRNTFGDIYTVDVSGNFFKCNSACVGAQSQQISAWLNTVGRNLSIALENSAEPITDSLFNISAHCLVENYPIEDWQSGNMSVTVTMLCTMPGKGRTVLGPYTVPSEVLAKLSEHCITSTNQIENNDTVGAISSRAEAIATGLEGTATGPVNTSPLAEWWNSLFERVPRARDHNDESCLEDDKEVSNPIWRKLL